MFVCSDSPYVGRAASSTLAPSVPRLIGGFPIPSEESCPVLKALGGPLETDTRFSLLLLASSVTFNKLTNRFTSLFFTCTKNNQPTTHKNPQVSYLLTFLFILHVAAHYIYIHIYKTAQWNSIFNEIPRCCCNKNNLTVSCKYALRSVTLTL